MPNLWPDKRQGLEGVEEEDFRKYEVIFFLSLIENSKRTIRVLQLEKLSWPIHSLKMWSNSFHLKMRNGDREGK